MGSVEASCLVRSRPVDCTNRGLSIGPIEASPLASVAPIEATRLDSPRPLDENNIDKVNAPVPGAGMRCGTRPCLRPQTWRGCHRSGPPALQPDPPARCRQALRTQKEQAGNGRNVASTRGATSCVSQQAAPANPTLSHAPCDAMRSERPAMRFLGHACCSSGCTLLLPPDPIALPLSRANHWVGIDETYRDIYREAYRGLRSSRANHWVGSGETCPRWEG